VTSVGFTAPRVPRIVFGAGSFDRLGVEVSAFGRRVLLLTGARSLRGSPWWPRLQAQLDGADLTRWEVAVDGEPSPELVDELVLSHRSRRVEVVLAVGGGSVLDAGKAVAGLLRAETTLLDHLEVVGRGLPYRGPAVPLVAVPTTAGTGSETTMNAVVSRCGPGGFKRSFRDEELVARVAVVDPELLAGVPPHLMAAQGMDAFTQLLESYLSVRAAPLSEALAWSGLEAFAAGFWDALAGGEGDVTRLGRSRLSYAAMVSGITLAQVGLGAVHGLAAPLGAFHPVPHGVACGTLAAEATRVNLAALRGRLPGSPALERYARVGRLLAGDGGLPEGAAAERLVEVLREWTDRLDLPRLSAFGVTSSDLDRVVADSRGSSMRTNPVVLEDGELGEILRARL